MAQRGIVAWLVVIVSLLATSCTTTIRGSGTSRSSASVEAPTSTSASTLVPAPAPSTSTAPPTPISQLGQPVTSLGVTVTITSAFAAASVDLNQSNRPTGSGAETYTTVPAGEGATFIFVVTQIDNNAANSMDLTCGYPVGNKLIDSQGRQFDQIDSLYQLLGNPGCNDNLQPGFSSPMTYIYQIPTSTTVTGWAFQDLTGFFQGLPRGPEVTVRFTLEAA